MIAATNAERAEAGCGPLRADSRLTAAAQGHAADMAANDYFSHTDQDGGDSADRIRAAGFAGSATGENIAYGQESAAEVVAAWMDSSGHRQQHPGLRLQPDRRGLRQPRRLLGAGLRRLTRDPVSAEPCLPLTLRRQRPVNSRAAASGSSAGPAGSSATNGAGTAGAAAGS